MSPSTPYFGDLSPSRDRCPCIHTQQSDYAQLAHFLSCKWLRFSVPINILKTSLSSQSHALYWQPIQEKTLHSKHTKIGFQIQSNSSSDKHTKIYLDEPRIKQMTAQIMVFVIIYDIQSERRIWPIFEPRRWDNMKITWGYCCEVILGQAGSSKGIFEHWLSFTDWMPATMSKTVKEYLVYSNISQHTSK